MTDEAFLLSLLFVGNCFSQLLLGYSAITKKPKNLNGLKQQRFVSLCVSMSKIWLFSMSLLYPGIQAEGMVPIWDIPVL